MLSKLCLGAIPVSSAAKCRSLSNNAYTIVRGLGRAQAAQKLPKGTSIALSGSRTRLRPDKNCYASVATTSGSNTSTGTACPDTAQPPCLTPADGWNGAVTPEMTSPAAGYRVPPAEILEIIDQPPEPSLSFSPDRKKAWLDTGL